VAISGPLNDPFLLLRYLVEILKATLKQDSVLEKYLSSIRHKNLNPKNPSKSYNFEDVYVPM
jgi:hypothetical protein